MTKLEITLTEEDRRFLENRTAEGGFSSPGDYLIELLRKDRQVARDRLKALLEEGLASESFEATDEWWEKKRRNLAARARERGMPE